MGKIDFTQVLYENGEPILDTKGQKLTLKSAVKEALAFRLQSNEQSYEDQRKRWNITKMLDKLDEVELIAEQVTLIQNDLAKRYSSIITGQAGEMLEGKKEEDSEQQ